MKTGNYRLESTTTYMLNLNHLTMKPGHFLTGTAHDIFEPGHYEELIANFPPFELATPGINTKGYVKFTLNDWFSPNTYWTFLENNKVWGAFADYVLGNEFKVYLIAALARNKIQLRREGWYTSFEFSFLPGLHGCIPPHVDNKAKAMAFVFSMVRDGEWQDEWDGGTQMLRQTTPGQQAFETTTTVPFRPNTCNVHLRKQGVSFHKVDCHGPEGSMRKTITLSVCKYEPHQGQDARGRVAP